MASNQRSVSTLTLFCIISLFSLNFVSAEKIEFSNKVASSGTNCYLESIAETVQGKDSEEQDCFFRLIILTFRFFC